MMTIPSSNQNALVCICVPTYNAGNTLEATLSSIVNQTYSNIRIIVVDNASKDNTVEIAERISRADSRVTVYSHDVNLGAEGNFNRCIQIACGDYTAIYHADDVYDPEIVAREVAYLDTNPDSGAVFTGAYRINSNDDILGLMHLPEEISFLQNLSFDFGQILPLVLRDYNFLVCPSAMIRTTVLKNEVVNWDGDSYRTSADLDVWFKILRENRIGIIPEPLMKYRVSESHGTARELYMKKGRADFFSVIDHYADSTITGYRLTARDKSNLLFLLFRDSSQRATNMIIDYEFCKAINLLRESNCLKLLINAIVNFNKRLVGRSRITYLLIGMALYLLAFVRLKFLADLLSQKKYGYKKVLSN